MSAAGNARRPGRTTAPSARGAGRRRNCSSRPCWSRGGRGRLRHGRVGRAFRGGRRDGGDRDGRAARPAAPGRRRTRPEKAPEKATARTLSGYSHRRFVVQTAMHQPRASTSGELRPVLEHLLAARLAERHGVNLYAEPGGGPAGCSAAARRRPTCGPGSTPSPGRGLERRRGRSAARHPAAAPWPASSTDWSSCDRRDIRTTEQTARRARRSWTSSSGRSSAAAATLELVLIGILAGGHVLLEDLPGLGKTLIARSFAQVLGLDFARIQFTPDLLPSDVVGAPLYDQRTAEMVFRPGPGLHPAAARRRDQPDAAQDPGGAARGDGRGPGERGRRDPQAARSRSSCWPPTTRSSTRAPTSCPRPSSTAS